RYDNLSLIVCTLSDPDCVRWLSENMKFGDEKAERLVREKYKSCEIVLDADDFQDYDTSIYE
ncbi:DpnD/PcfM family protein, partial [Streptococcus pneumoniae]|uniref:DpnD/PcfM family protein n=1 Tax=Streptococcus pneumoniae TaxID=1313 RepID=UPI001D17387F